MTSAGSFLVPLRSPFVPLLAFLLYTCALALAGCAAATPPPPPPEPIELRLATEPHLSRLAQDLTRAFSERYPYVTFEISVRSSQDATAAVASREIDVALVAEPALPERTELESTQIGQEAVVLAVHPPNPVGALTWQQVRDIFSGQVWDWAKVDPQWGSQEILVVSQQEGAVSRVEFERQVMEGVRVTPRAVIATGDEVAGKLIANEPAAIGYLLAGVASDNVKILTIDGMMPDQSVVKSTTWPITCPINLVTHVDANVYVLDFVDFAKMR